MRQALFLFLCFGEVAAFGLYAIYFPCQEILLFSERLPDGDKNEYHTQRSVIFIFLHSSRISLGQILACISPMCAFFR